VDIAPTACRYAPSYFQFWREQAFGVGSIVLNPDAPEGHAIVRPPVASWQILKLPTPTAGDVRYDELTLPVRTRSKLVIPAVGEKVTELPYVTTTFVIPAVCPNRRDAVNAANTTMRFSFIVFLPNLSHQPASANHDICDEFHVMVFPFQLIVLG
jgi:hypothetical protein